MNRFDPVAYVLQIQDNDRDLTCSISPVEGSTLILRHGDREKAG